MSVIWDLEDDLLLDLGLGLSRDRHFCLKCPLDLTDFTEDELHGHVTFHRLLSEARKSIPSQDSRLNFERNSERADRQAARMWGLHQ